MSELRFEPEGHKYFLGDRELPSVTRILKALNLVDDQWYQNEYLKPFGHAMHMICGLWVTVQPEKLAELMEREENVALRPRLKACQEWCEEVGFVADHVEVPVYDPVYGYAGTLDALGHWNKDDSVVLPDWKSGKVEWWVELQTAAYERAARLHGLLGADRSCVRVGVELRDNGRAYPTPYRPPNNHERLWLSAIALYNEKAQHSGGKLP